MNKLKEVLSKTIYFIYYTLILLFIFWNICYGFIIGYVLLLVFIYAVAIMKKRKLKNIILVLLFSVLGYILALPYTLWQYQNRSNKLYAKIENGKELAFHEKLSIYGLNLSIGFVAFPIYPEVSKETLYLCFPAKNKIREFESDFFLESKVIQKAIKYNKKHVGWQRGSYAFDKEEARYALTLNACDLDITKYKNSIEYKVTVEVAYPLKNEAILFNWPSKIAIEEGLFGYLQKIGWLYPYKAVWKCEKPLNQ